MSTAPDPKFPDLPGLIFGYSPSKHRRSPVKMLLGRYNVKVRSNDKKEDYLLKLVELENSIGEREKEALMNWFAGENTCKALAALLGDAMQPPITPKNIDEPPVKKSKLSEAEAEDDLIFAAVDKCGICMNKLAPEKFPQSRITSTCAHHPTVCKKCLTQHINIEVQTKASYQISCPECPEKVSDEEIKTYASPEILERNRRRTFMMSHQHLPNFTFCLNLTCESGQIHAEPGQPMMNCTRCGFKTCFIHKLPWHEDLTCAEFDILNQDRVQHEAASEAWIAKNTKLCPNPECGMRIEKKTGCDRLTCDYCLFEFCWVCCADFNIIKKRGNDAHKPDCEWHTSNRNGMPGYDRRRVAAPRQPAEPKAPKEPKESKRKRQANSEQSEAGGASKDLCVREELKALEGAGVLEEMNEMKDAKVSEEFKQSHEPNITHNVKPSYIHKISSEPTEPSEAIGLTQPNVSEDAKESTQHIQPPEPAKLLDTIKATGSIQPNPFKRPHED